MMAEKDTGFPVAILRLNAVALGLWALLVTFVVWRRPRIQWEPWHDFSRSVENLAPVPVRYDMMPNYFWIYGLPLMVTFTVMALRRVAKAINRRLG